MALSVRCDYRAGRRGNGVSEVSKWEGSVVSRAVRSCYFTRVAFLTASSFGQFFSRYLLPSCAI